MTDRDLLELIATQVNKLTKDVDELKASMATKDELAEVKDNMATKDELAEVKDNMATKNELAEVKNNMVTKDELAEVKSNMATKDELAEVKVNMATAKDELETVKNIVVRIENDHGQKLAALFDGQKQNSEKLDRIEREVSRHEEIIMRRIR